MLLCRIFNHIIKNKKQGGLCWENPKIYSNYFTNWFAYNRRVINYVLTGQLKKW